MSSTRPSRTPRRRSRRQEQADAAVAAVEYGLEAIGERVNETFVRRFQSLSGVMLRGARPVKIGDAGTLRASTSPCSLVGWALHNTGATPVQVNLLDGIDTGGDLVAPITLAVGESTRDSWAPGGLSIQTALFVEITGGTVEGCVYLRGPE